MNTIFTLSEKAKEEYSCTIVRIGEIKPIEGSDFLALTMVNGNPIVIRRDSVKEGDIMIYAPIETALNHEFLSANNLYEIGEYHLNSNHKEVSLLIEQDKKDEAKKIVGFFNRHGRVKLIRLRGCPSMGFLITKNDLVKWDKDIEDVDLNELVGTDFDTINNKLFVKAYVPYTPPMPIRLTKAEKRAKKLKKYPKLIDGEFRFHYDTSLLPKYIHLIKPDDEVVISAKMHGTSICLGNVLMKKPIELNIIQKTFNKIAYKNLRKLKEANRAINYNKAIFDIAKLEKFKKLIRKSYKLAYGNIYSSRTQIKNISSSDVKRKKNVRNGFYGVDVWGKFNELLKDYIPEGMMIYGEICGYVNNNGKLIQKDYDYGCDYGENFLMPYRITTSNSDHTKKEWEVSDVFKWMVNLIKKHPELKGVIKPINILYQGTLHNLYPDININEHWHENILERLRNDKEHFFMEEMDPMCNNKVPFEGIVLRICGDKFAEAFKLKCIRFKEKEQKNYDKGVTDIEVLENNY